MKQIDAHKTLKEPAHGGTLSWFLELIGNTLQGGGELLTYTPFGQLVHQQTEGHDKGDAAQRLCFDSGGVDCQEGLDLPHGRC
jgi:hypothetical protein